MGEEPTVRQALGMIGRLMLYVLHRLLIDSWNRRPNGDRRIWSHGQNLNERDHARVRGPWWVHSRFWIYAWRAQVNVEWVFRLRQYPALEVSYLGHEHDLAGHVTFPGLALYITLSGLLRGERWSKRRCWEGHETGLTYHDGLLWLRFLHPNTGSWDSKESWWTRGEICVHVHDILFGRPRHSTRVLDEGPCIIPMPEGNYLAHYRIEEATWRYARRFTRRRISTRIEVDKAHGSIPFPGKGENAYDCGMDGLVSTGAAGANVQEAVGRVVGQVLDYRRRYGGPRWQPQPDQHSAMPR